MLFEDDRDEIDWPRCGDAHAALRQAGGIGRVHDRDVRAADLEARELVGRRSAHRNFHRVDEWPPGPVVFVRAQQQPLGFDPLQTERPAANRIASGAADRDGVFDVRELPKQVRSRTVRFDDDQIAVRDDLPGRFAAKRRCHLRRLERRAIMKLDARSKAKTPPHRTRVVLPRLGEPRRDPTVAIDDHERLEHERQEPGTRRRVGCVGRQRRGVQRS